MPEHQDAASAPEAAPGLLPPLLAACGAGAIAIGVCLRIFQGGAAAALTEPSLNLARLGVMAFGGALIGLGRGLGPGLVAPPRRVWIPAVLWIASALLAAPGAVDGLSALYALGARVEDVILVLGLSHVIGGVRGGRRMALALVLACGLGAVALGLKDRWIDRPATRDAYLADPDALAADIPEELRADLESRLFADQASGPFLLPNGLGALGALLAAAGAGIAFAAAGPARMAGAAVSVAGLLACWASAQRGCYLALATGLAVVAAGALARHRHRWATRAALAPAVGSLALIAAIVFLPAAWLDRAPGGTSLAVRHDYSIAALRMAAERPLLGVGPGNFQVHYNRVKPEGGEETRLAHNDWLQAVAEQGPLGLLALLALWWGLTGWTLPRRRPDTATPPAPATEEARPGDDDEGQAGLDPTRTQLALALGAAVGALLLPALAADGHRDTSVAVGLAVAIPLILWALRTAFASLPASGLRVAADAGLAALLFQAGIDFVHHEPGLLAAGLVLALVGRPLFPVAAPPRPSRALGFVIGCGCAAVAVYLALVALPAVAASDGAKRAARQLLARGELEAAAEELGLARDALPADDEARVALGDLAAALWRQGADPRALESAIDLYTEVAAARPDLADVKARLARLHLEAHDRPLGAHWLRAAIAADPSMPRAHLELARLLAGDAAPDAALVAAEARAALRLDPLARSVRNRLTDAERDEARALLATASDAPRRNVR